MIGVSRVVLAIGLFALGCSPGNGPEAQGELGGDGGSAGEPSPSGGAPGAPATCCRGQDAYTLAGERWRLTNPCAPECGCVTDGTGDDEPFGASAGAPPMLLECEF